MWNSSRTRRAFLLEAPLKTPMEIKILNHFLLLIQQGQQPGIIGMLLPWILIFGIFYFLIIRPQQRRQRLAAKEREDLLASLKVGDKVITNGGIFGTIAAANEDSLTLRIADKVNIKVERSAVTRLQAPETKEVKEAEAGK
ncbi:MAG TPA: preprotein translocase subunit YajC [Blastocatellia bacterium]